jgi:chemotaxis protein CheD
MSGVTSLPSLFIQRIVVGVGDMAVSNNTATTLSTYALGSCIAVIAYDTGCSCGGILHIMLPEASVSPTRAVTQPAMFADTGLPLFCKALIGLKADRSRLKLFVAGGASVLAGHDPFRIGERNALFTLKFLEENRLNVVKTDTGGTFNRTVHLEMSTGTVTLVSPNGRSTLSLC